MSLKTKATVKDNTAHFKSSLVIPKLRQTVSASEELEKLFKDPNNTDDINLGLIKLAANPRLATQAILDDVLHCLRRTESQELVLDNATKFYSRLAPEKYLREFLTNIIGARAFSSDNF